MTASTLERPAGEVLYPKLNRLWAVTECLVCGCTGRVEWLPNGSVRVLHKGKHINRICNPQLASPWYDCG